MNRASGDCSSQAGKARFPRRTWMSALLFSLAASIVQPRGIDGCYLVPSAGHLSVRSIQR